MCGSTTFDEWRHKMKVVISKEEFAALDTLFQAEYKEADGSFVLNADGIDNHPDVKALKGAYTGEKDKRTAAAKRLEELDAAKKLADEATLAEQQKFKDLSDLKTVEAQKYADELKALKDKVVQTEMDGIARKIATAINKEDPRRQNSLIHEIKPYLKNTENGISLLNADGTPTDEKSIIAKLTTDFPFLAAANPAGGGGGSGNNNPTAPATPPKTAAEANKAAWAGV